MTTTTAEFLQIAGWVILVVVGPFAFLFLIYLAAKLMSYGWKAGEHRFEQDKLKKERDRGSSRR